VTADLDPQLFVYVKIPGDIQPLARGERFEDPLQVALQAEQLGNVSGGGSQLDDPYPDGRPRVEFSGLDVDVVRSRPSSAGHRVSERKDRESVGVDAYAEGARGAGAGRTLRRSQLPRARS
jgi:hypothetical protein